MNIPCPECGLAMQEWNTVQNGIVVGNAMCINALCLIRIWTIYELRDNMLIACNV